MLPDELKNLAFLSAHDIFRCPEDVPAYAGVYLVFLRGGLRILQATSYFDTAEEMPLSIRDHDHLYTGAASNLRDRLEQHMRRDIRSSSLRKTLLAIEHQQRAISGCGRHMRRIVNEESLTEWMCCNAVIGIQFTSAPFDRERELISRYHSPFNITLRRHHPYSKALMMWRSATFPRWRPTDRRELVALRRTLNLGTHVAARNIPEPEQSKFGTKRKTESQMSAPRRRKASGPELLASRFRPMTRLS